MTWRVLPSLFKDEAQTALKNQYVPRRKHF
jgi:hypothetical protein